MVGKAKRERMVLLEVDHASPGEGAIQLMRLVLFGISASNEVSETNLIARFPHVKESKPSANGRIHRKGT